MYSTICGPQNSATYVWQLNTVANEGPTSQLQVYPLFDSPMNSGYFPVIFLNNFIDSGFSGIFLSQMRTVVL